MKSLLSTSILVLAMVGLLAQPASRQRVKQHDADADGQITKEEFLVGAEARFHKMDVDGDGVLTESDAQARRSERVLKRVGSLMAQRADADQSQTVTREEWSAFISGLESNEDGAIDLKQLFHRRHEGPSRGGPKPEREAEEGKHGSALDLNGNGILDADDLGQVFDRMDQNQDLVIDRSEVVLRRERSSEGHRRGARGERGERRGPPGVRSGLFKQADQNEDGDVSAEEWQSFLAGLPVTESGAIDIQAWLGDRGERFAHMLDSDGDGALERSDLEDKFNQLDVNDDGVLQKEEMGRQRHPRGPRR